MVAFTHRYETIINRIQYAKKMYSGKVSFSSWINISTIMKQWKAMPSQPMTIPNYIESKHRSITTSICGKNIIFVKYLPPVSRGKPKNVFVSNIFIYRFSRLALLLAIIQWHWDWNGVLQVGGLECWLIIIKFGNSIQQM